MIINDISLKKAQWFAELSALAYKDEKTQKLFFTGEGIGTHQFIDSDGTQVMLYTKDKEVGIIFRGTEPTQLSDILADLDIRKKKAKKDDGYVHAGFQESLDDVWEAVKLFLSKNEYDRIYLSGHSLGAAIATLAAARLEKCTAVYTFGSPRVGGRKFVKANKSILHWRFINNNDIVTRVPTALRWKHHGCRVYIDRKGNVSTISGYKLWADLLLGHLSSWCKLKFFDSFSDHSITKYYQHLSNFNK